MYGVPFTVLGYIAMDILGLQKKQIKNKRKIYMIKAHCSRPNGYYSHYFLQMMKM
jgi:hypothetical protein